MTPEDMQSVKVPLDEFVREIAREAAREVIREHVEACKIQDVDIRLMVLENKLTYSRGFLAGVVAVAALVGGLIGFSLKGLGKLL